MTDSTFGFVDLAGFTALTEAHGDADALHLLERFVKLAGPPVRDRGVIVKTIGDAIMLAFPSPASALLATVDLFAILQRENGFPAIRAGLHHGPAIERNGDFFGASVNLAARVADQARGGQLLVTSSVAVAVQTVELSAIDLGEHRLRNVSEPVRLFDIALAEADAPSFIDPVCRMRIELRKAVGDLRYAGRAYQFCSLHCAGAFAASPESYV